MIKAVHIEDEYRNVKLLETMLQKHCPNTIQLLGFAGSVKEAIELIQKEQPQLVFLDIEINQGNAFELLEELKNTSGIHFDIIFLTAYNQYAIKAFREQALDYLLKPISSEELVEAVNRAVQKIQKGNNEQNIAALLQEIKKTTTPTKIGLPLSDAIKFVPTNDIVRLEAKGNAVLVHLLNNEKITCIKTLGDLETMLPAHQFIRVHNSWIINTRFLKKYFRGKNGYLQMDDDAIVPVSIRKKGGFLDQISF